MADYAIQKSEEIATVERLESHFEEKHTKVFYSVENLFLFPTIFEKDGGVSFDISNVTWQHGIHTPIYLSGSLYCLWLQLRLYNPIKNIATLCHAFLYHVDLDEKNTIPLVFPVPGIGSEPYIARASIRGWKNEFIYFDLVEE